MDKINFSKIYSKLTKGLDKRSREVLDRRFGIRKNKQESGGETLQSIGENFDITRERVRQIEAKAFSDIKQKNKEVLDKVFNKLTEYFKKRGGFKKEDIVLKEVGRKKYQPYVRFLLNLGDKFSLTTEKDNFYSFWTIKKDPIDEIKKASDKMLRKFKEIGKPVLEKEFISDFSSGYNFEQEYIRSVLEISKQIDRNKEGKVGLISWPEINPKGVRDKSLLVFRKTEKPLHFKKVAKLIDKLGYNPGKKTYPQTVHNELIKDSRFVLVGRGMYALKEWGYAPGTVKDIIKKVLKENRTPLKKEKVIEKVLEQRLVARNTVLMNLNNNDCFMERPNEKYILDEEIQES